MRIRGKIIFMIAIPVVGLMAITLVGTLAIRGLSSTADDIVNKSFVGLINHEVTPLLEQEVAPLITADIPLMNDLQNRNELLLKAEIAAFSVVSAEKMALAATEEEHVEIEKSHSIQKNLLRKLMSEALRNHQDPGLAPLIAKYEECLKKWTEKTDTVLLLSLIHI